MSGSSVVAVKECQRGVVLIGALVTDVELVDGSQELVIYGNEEVVEDLEIL